MSIDHRFPERADAGLAWAVKTSFSQYVRTLRDGRIAVDGGAAMTSTGEFYFPFVGASQRSGRTSLEFGGVVRFVAHYGLLAVEIARPTVQLGGDGRSSLSIADGAAGQQLADVDLRDPIHDAGITMWRSAAATLSAGAVDLFAATYPAGEALAPLTLRVPTSALPAPESAPTVFDRLEP